MRYNTRSYYRMCEQRGGFAPLLASAAAPIVTNLAQGLLTKTFQIWSLHVRDTFERFQKIFKK